ncbi:MAG: DNA-processing protein DprA [Cyclobacteriaceae bacterium]
MDEKIYQVALELMPGIGDISARQLISYTGSASSVYTADRKVLSEIPGVNSRIFEMIAASKPFNEAKKIVEDCERLDIQILHYTDNAFPHRLKETPDFPNVIYTRGNANLNEDRMIAVVGTRNATYYGKSTTERVIEDLAPLQPVVVSGLAYGIDIHAHKAALEHGVKTYAVLAGGLDKIYPSVHKKVVDQILEQGAIISENPPGVQAEAHFFPARNRIIAGMSDATIVVEAAKKGGALITANIADSYNRVVFAIPGNLNNSFSEGCNQLIRSQKANLYRNKEDLDYHLGWTAENNPIKTRKLLGLLTPLEQQVYELLSTEKDGVAIDMISVKTDISSNQLSAILLNLEFQGFIKSLPGKKYKTNY